MLYGVGMLVGVICYILKCFDFIVDMFEVCVEVYNYLEFDEILIDFGFIFNKQFGDNFVICGLLDFLNDSGFVDQLFLLVQLGVFNLDFDFIDVVVVFVNLCSEEDVDFEEVIFGCIVVCWMLIDWFDGMLIYYYQQVDIGGCWILFECVVYFGVGVNIFCVGLFDNVKCVFELNEIINDFLVLEVIVDFGFVELMFVIGFLFFEDDGQCDQNDFLILFEYLYELFLVFVLLMCEVGEEEIFIQEVCLVFSYDGLFDWIVGGFYLKNEFVGLLLEFILGYDMYVINMFGFGFLVDCLDDLEYFLQLYLELIEVVLFGEVGYQIIDCFNIIVGVCWYDYEFEEFSVVDFLLFDFGFMFWMLDEILE